jgi:hypothetical protein
MIDTKLRAVHCNGKGYSISIEEYTNKVALLIAEYEKYLSDRRGYSEEQKLQILVDGLRDPSYADFKRHARRSKLSYHEYIAELRSEVIVCNRENTIAHMVADTKGTMENMKSLRTTVGTGKKYYQDKNPRTDKEKDSLFLPQAVWTSLSTEERREYKNRSLTFAQRKNLFDRHNRDYGEQSVDSREQDGALIEREGTSSHPKKVSGRTKNKSAREPNWKTTVTTGRYMPVFPTELDAGHLEHHSSITSGGDIGCASASKSRTRLHPNLSSEASVWPSSPSWAGRLNDGKSTDSKMAEDGPQKTVCKESTKVKDITKQIRPSNISTRQAIIRRAILESTKSSFYGIMDEGTDACQLHDGAMVVERKEHEILSLGTFTPDCTPLYANLCTVKKTRNIKGTPILLRFYQTVSQAATNPHMLIAYDAETRQNRPCQLSQDPKRLQRDNLICGDQICHAGHTVESVPHILTATNASR